MFDKVNTALYYALSEAGIEIPNPQFDIHLFGQQDGEWKEKSIPLD
jgi:small-conductance mechanosensitive channel